ncbi:GGDEF domain-containing protein [Candidatus Collierbacteria bacterium]|nr:GGDEF domain-containing protein [Candidatus Collierbacteria bacterium]
MPEPSAERETSRQKISRLEAENKVLKVQLAEAIKESGIDSLTGLPNRKFLSMELERQLALVSREGGCVAVAIIDLDEFKKVNDTYGHPQGDAVLKGFANRANLHTRPSDIFGRWGGEEFLAVFSAPEGMNVEEVKIIILKRYHEMLIDLNRTGKKDDFIPQTISIGCVVIDSKFDSSLLEVIAAADAELYKSKTNGKNMTSIVSYPN